MLLVFDDAEIGVIRNVGKIRAIVADGKPSNPDAIAWPALLQRGSRNKRQPPWFAMKPANFHIVEQQ